jgi:hypothetical protein
VALSWLVIAIDLGVECFGLGASGGDKAVGVAARSVPLKIVSIDNIMSWKKQPFIENIFRCIGFPFDP